MNAPFLNSTSAGIADTDRAPAQYPFQNPDLSADERITNLLSLMTLDEKIACLGTDPSVPRLGVKGSRHVEGIHGLAQGGAPSKWGRPAVIPTTTFPRVWAGRDLIRIYSNKSRPSKVMRHGMSFKAVSIIKADRRQVAKCRFGP